MKVFEIKTSAVQGVLGDTEKIETANRGTLKKTPAGFIIRYTENIFTDAPEVFTEILITPEKTVTITKDGGVKSKMVIEENNDHSCLYATPVGNLDLIISGNRVNYILTDSGGEIFLSYHIKQENVIISKNEITIKVKEVI